ncbi:uncharacterized protein BCR38DRAFT_410144 [Pseudomassariella vexata]|uniref:Acid phosphatase-like protein n=1 Tax=Pseudomassariella vexata TaxID=1141098 RepID=A0A1Y2DVH3_9PEZI|nr:uncharacterized protein BCR38DRAFT_410144 [Pseudomassariella vexata]ORY63189.1 hypothetical protein BCR38DRAFT_410144 [Pseudomassariella vexata]
MNSVGIFFIVFLVLLVVAAAGWVIFSQLRARRLGVPLRERSHDNLSPGRHCRSSPGSTNSVSIQLPAPTISSYNPFTRADSSPYGAPTPAPGGIRGWFNDKIRSRNNRSAVGAYEQPLQSTDYSHGRRGFGPLDPDEAWDTRVGTEADAYAGYYEEQELGNALGGRGNPYNGSDYPMNLAATPGTAHEGYGGDQHEERGRSRSRGRSPVPGASGLGVPGKGVNQNPFDDDAEPANTTLKGVSPRPINTASAVKAGGTRPTSDSPSERRSMFREDV